MEKANDSVGTRQIYSVELITANSIVFTLRLPYVIGSLQSHEQKDLIDRGLEAMSLAERQLQASSSAISAARNSQATVPLLRISNGKQQGPTYR